MPHISHGLFHWSVRWPHLFVSWHRGTSVNSITNVGDCRGFVVALPGGSLEVSWGPPNRGTGLYDRACTCHPDDNPPRPCPRRFAYTECVRAGNLAARVRQ